jgi:hypothetical protein
MPYVTGHSALHDESIIYLSAAETWVDIFESKYQKNYGKLIHFITESGVIEFVLIGSATHDSPKRT